MRSFFPARHGARTQRVQRRRYFAAMTRATLYNMSTRNGPLSLASGADHRRIKEGLREGVERERGVSSWRVAATFIAALPRVVRRSPLFPLLWVAVGERVLQSVARGASAGV